MYILIYLLIKLVFPIRPESQASLFWGNVTQTVILALENEAGALGGSDGVALTFFPGVKNVPVDVSAHAQ